MLILKQAIAACENSKPIVTDWFRKFNKIAITVHLFTQSSDCSKLTWLAKPTKNSLACAHARLSY